MSEMFKELADCPKAAREEQIKHPIERTSLNSSKIIYQRAENNFKKHH